MRLYGLRGITHGGGVVLTVLSPSGARAAMRRIGTVDGAACRYHAGALPVYHELRAGALARMVREQAVRELDFREWDALKRRLGETIYR